MNRLKFEGKGFDFFKIHFVNVILTTFSLTLLYPWAKVRELNYLSRNASLGYKAFAFEGSTKEFFKGYLKTFLSALFVLLLAFGGGFILAGLQGSMLYGIAYFIIVIGCLLISYLIIPIVLHGSLTYRLNNLTWGEIRFAYTGKLSELVPLFFTNILLTSLTAGLYNAWYQVKLLKFLLPNIQFGDLSFDFKGEGKSLFFLLLKGFLLSAITFGIYGIWFAKELYEYLVSNTVVKKDDHEFQLHSDANMLEVFETTLSCILLIVLTLGIGASWAYILYYRFLFNHCVIPADFNVESIGALKGNETKSDSGKFLDRWNPLWIV